MVCRNMCLRLYANAEASGHYSAGTKYCRTCEYYLITSKMSCECCGKQLRASPAARVYKEKVRLRKTLPK